MAPLRDTPLKHKLTDHDAADRRRDAACGRSIRGLRADDVRNTLVADVSGSGAIIGHNSSAALTFGDPDSAAQTLQSLGTDSHVVGAALYDRSGQLFASINAPLSIQFQPPAAGSAGIDSRATG